MFCTIGCPQIIFSRHTQSFQSQCLEQGVFHEINNFLIQIVQQETQIARIGTQICPETCHERCEHISDAFKCTIGHF